jgi:hypothetical protein
MQAGLAAQEVMSYEDMGAIIAAVLIVLSSGLSYLTRHPGAVEQTYAKLFPHNGE